MQLSDTPIKILEGIAVVFGLFFTFLYLNDVLMPEGFFFAIAGAAIFMFLCIIKEIYAESFLHLFYIVTGILGFYFYENTPVSEWDINWHFYLIIASVLATLFVGFLLKKNSNSKLPYIDAFTTVFSIGATWLMITWEPTNWFYWVVIDSVTVFLYYRRGLKMGALLYAIYLLMAIQGSYDVLIS